MVLRYSMSASRVFHRGMATYIPLLGSKERCIGLEPSPREKLAQVMAENSSLPLEATSLAFSHFMKKLEERKRAPLSLSFKLAAWKIVKPYTLEKTQNLFRERVSEDILVHLTREETQNAIKTIQGEEGANPQGWQKLVILSLIYKEPLQTAEIHTAASQWDRWSNDLRSLIAKELSNQVKSS